MHKLIKKCHKSICNSNYIKHKTKKRVLLKFLSLILIIGIYFVFISLEYGLSSGFLVTALTWSFFVLCTPIADAGFLLDFPIRLITRFKMLHSEIIVWIIAISLNSYFMMYNISVYNSTKLLTIFYEILSNPFPFWSIIFISGIGTFLSVYFGDELIDVAHHHERKKYHMHKDKYHLILLIFIIVITIFLYYYLIKKLHLNI